MSSAMKEMVEVVLFEGDLNMEINRSVAYLLRTSLGFWEVLISDEKGDEKKQ